MKSLLPLFCCLLAGVFFSCQSTETKQGIPSNSSTVNQSTIEQHITKSKDSLLIMAGQLTMVGVRGMKMDDISPVFRQQLKSGMVGGIILFDYDIVTKSARNIESPEQLKSFISGLNKLSSQPLFMAIDQEGGVVNRLKEKYGFPASVSAKYLGQLDNLDSTRHYAIKNAKNLDRLGFNVNFAPVVDMDLNEKNPVIGKYKRSFSADAKTIIKHAGVWIKEHSKQNILSTLKHFPGHGSSDADSHQGITDITPYWSAVELIPFEQLLKGDRKPLTAVMTAHVVNKKLDDEYPATLSKKVIKRYLRDEWQFDGLVFSDDLQMKAVNELYDLKTIVKRSLLAGVDVLVIGNNLEYDEEIASKVVEIIVNLVKSGEVAESRLRQSYQRVIETKKELFLIRNQ